MLEKLFIENVALIDRAELEFSGGLNVLTGETGAGKSVILDCIDFALGAKADKSMIRYGAAECSVRAEFSVCGDPVNELLSELGIEADDDVLLVSRKLTQDGRGSIRVNGTPVTASMLRRITALLVDVHGQSEHFYLLKESNQLRLLDGIAGEPVAAAKERLKPLLARRKEIADALGKLGGDEGERARRMDILRYQIDEIARADLREGEEERLLDFRTRYRNAEKILQGLSAARDYLSADGGGIDALNGARRNTEALARYGDAYSGLAERMENAAAELGDIAEAIGRELDALDIDEAEAERAEQRLSEIRDVIKKYGGSVQSALSFQKSAEAEFDLLAKSGERAAELNAEREETEERIYRVCLDLAAARKEAAKGFCARVTAELSSLNIAAAKFEVAFKDFGRDDAPSATAEGLGGVCFLFSANAGEPLKELGQIISGGEMSRFMLAVKAQLTALGDIGTYIFDEIDAGIGGKTARVVAEKFCKLSRGVQVIAVTHLAQIAGFADRAFYIEKRENGGRTETVIREVAGEERVREIARLIDGGASKISLEHARQLLEGALAYKNSLS